MADPDTVPNRGIVLAAGLALAVGGGIAHSIGREDNAALEALKTELAATRVKDARDALIAKQEPLDYRTGIELGAGAMAMAVGGTLIAAGLLSMIGVRFRTALLWIGLLPFLAASYYAVFHAGPEALVPVTLIGVGYFLYLTWFSDQRGRNAATRFAQFPSRIDQRAAEPSAYRSTPATAKSLKLAEVPTPPWAMRALDSVGGGQVFRTYLLKNDLAYVAFVEADLTDVSDYVTVVLKLEDKAPTFVARPLPIDDGKPVVNSGLLFREDREFSAEFLVEVPHGQQPVAVREFLAENIRDELMGLPDVWLRVEGTIATLTRYGQFNVEKTDELVELADAIFAEVGAEGGPSLLEPDGVVVKKKKKKSAQPAYSPA